MLKKRKRAKRRRAVATFKLDKHFSFRLVAHSRYLLLMRWEWMDLVKLREREKRARRGGEREGGRCLLQCVWGGDWRRGEERRRGPGWMLRPSCCRWSLWSSRADKERVCGRRRWEQVRWICFLFDRNVLIRWSRFRVRRRHDIVFFNVLDRSRFPFEKVWDISWCTFIPFNS